MYLVGNLRFTSPNGGERYFALKPTVVSWFTLGDLVDVDLYYSTDPLRAPGSWVKINTDEVISGRGHNNSSQYFWEVTDYPSVTVWLRVQDAAYTQMFPVTTPGPYDDCDATFNILYYAIEWHVYNAATADDLDKLTVSDSSGWSESGLLSPVVHYYPYGNYDTVWSRSLFKSKVEFNWLADDNKTIGVALEESDEEPDFDVMANFAYNSASKTFDIQSWIERGGQVL